MNNDMVKEKISIIIPTFNEEENIGKMLERIYSLNIKDYEVIIVDDSFDNTAKLASKIMKKLKIRGLVIKRRNKHGKGSAIRDGLSLAQGENIVLIDADMQYPPEKIPLLIKNLKRWDIVNTKRIRRDPFYRKLLGYCFRALVFILFGIKEETQSTMRAFRKKVKEMVKFSSNSWAWDVEFIYRAKKLGFRMYSIPVEYGIRKSGKSKIKFSTPFKMFLELLKIRLKLL